MQELELIAKSPWYLKLWRPFFSLLYKTSYLIYMSERIVEEGES